VHSVQVSSVGKPFAAKGLQQLIACRRSVEAVGRDLRGGCPGSRTSLVMQSVKITLQGSNHSHPRAQHQACKWLNLEYSQAKRSWQKVHTF
jgi:hypothetical protein